LQANAAPVPSPDPTQALNNLVASLVLAQAAAKLSQQHQQQQQQTSPLSASIAQSWSIPGQTTINITGPPNATGALPTSSITDLASAVPVVTPQDVSQATPTIHQSDPHSGMQEERLHPKIAKFANNKYVSKEQRLKAAYEEQQNALRLAFEQSLKQAQEEERLMQTESAPHPQVTAVNDHELDRPNDSTKQPSPAELLQRSYEAHLASLQKEERHSECRGPRSKLETLPPSLKVTSGQSSDDINVKKKKKKKKTRDTNGQVNVDEDEGRQLMVGFLQSLRGSFEDAMGKNVRGNAHAVAQHEQVRKERKKRPSCASRSTSRIAKKTPADKPNICGSIGQPSPKSADSNTKMTLIDRYHNQKRKLKPASVTETSSGSSSQPTTEQSSSSLEDSDSKSEKTDQSSTSDEFENDDARRSKGPPRKRLKIRDNKQANEFTVENVLEHSKRMHLEQGGNSESASDC
jgi:hypothetical protein